MKKKILPIIIIVAVILLAGVSVFLGNKLLTTRNESISPAAPESKPAAAEPDEICNVDIMLVLDRTGSMSEKDASGITKMQHAKDAAKAFVQKFKDMQPTAGPVRIGITTLYHPKVVNGWGLCNSDNDTFAILELNLTSVDTGYDTLISTINGLQATDLTDTSGGAGTCVSCAIKIANNQFTNNQQDWYTVLLSDGYAMVGDDANTSCVTLAVGAQQALTSANTGRSQGISYFAVGYSTSDPNDDSLYYEETLTNVANDPNSTYFRHEPDPDTWVEAFTDIAAKICSVPEPTSTPTPNITHCLPLEWDLNEDVPTITPTPTVTPTTTPTATPIATPTATATPKSCNLSCDSNADCTSDLICSGGMCRRPECLGETDCTCPQATSTPTIRPTLGPTATPVGPSLPNAGVGTPTIMGIGGGIILIITALLLAL